MYSLSCLLVKCDENMPSLHTAFCSISQGSVLGLFCVYTALPLSILCISSFSLIHHLCADNTLLLSVDARLEHHLPRNIVQWMDGCYELKSSVVKAVLDQQRSLGPQVCMSEL